MTLLPFPERHKVHPWSGGLPYLGRDGQCSSPFCTRMGVEKHHITRRSELIGAYDWVEYDGLKIGNVVLLCNPCHSQITENKTRIGWSTTKMRYLWGDVGSKVLDPHPPVEGEIYVEEPAVDAPDMSGGEQSDVCKECLRPLPRKHKHEEGKVRKTWSIAVPLTEQENGAEVLDTLVEESRKQLAESGVAYSDDKKAKFFVLSAALSMFVLHGGKIMGDS